MNKASTSKPCLFTFGHSDRKMPEFLSLLTRHRIDVIADVRSRPYSHFHAQFNREMLAESLKRVGVRYLFLGRELGARRSETESYRDKQARYDLICRLPAFREGLERLKRGIADHRICLLCAEKDPITCHRTILVCRHLRSEPIDILHILDDGSLETTERAEARLLDLVGLPHTHLFQDRSQLIEEAYDLQGNRIAYTENEVSPIADGAMA
jgi:uncharacterized protein (DUF488 family)